MISGELVFSTVGHFPGIFPCVSAFHTRARAVAFVTSKARDLVARGDFVTLSEYHLEPPPIPSGSVVRVGGSESKPVNAPAPSHVECVTYEIRLLRLRDGVTCFYRVTQHPGT